MCTQDLNTDYGRESPSPTNLAPPLVFAMAPLVNAALPIATKTQRGNVKTQAATGTAARSSSHDRGKKKVELERLRCDAKMLESRLARLKKPGDSMGMTTCSSSSSDDDGMDDSLNCTNTLAATWKVVAVRQYQRRKQSDIMNRDLKRALTIQ